MFAVLIGMCLLNTIRLFVFDTTNIDNLGLTVEDAWMLVPPRRYKKALAARRARPLAAICITNY